MTETNQGAQLRPRAELLAMLDKLVADGMAERQPSHLLSPLSEAAERIRADTRAPIPEGFVVVAVVVKALRDIVDFCDDPNGSEGRESLALGLARLLPAGRQALASPEASAVEGGWKLDREALMALVRRELTDNLVDTVSLQPCGKPDVLLAGCKAVGYRHPEMAASEFSGFVADAILALKPSGRPSE